MHIRSVLLYLSIIMVFNPQWLLANPTCHVDYNISDEWGNGFTAQVKITNNGVGIDRWQVNWDMPDAQSITGLWNGQLQQQGDTVEVTHYDWNRNVASGSHIEFGFNASHLGVNRKPSNITLNGELCSGQAVVVEPDPVACQANYTITSIWNEGFQAEVRIENIGGALNTWELNWTQPGTQQITNLWNGQLNQTNQNVAVNNLDWNKSVAQNAEIQLGFVANHNGNVDLPSDIHLNGVLCEGQTPPEPEPVSCHVDYQVSDQWQDGFTANVVVHNTGATLAEWQVQWTMPLAQDVTHMWNGVYTQDNAQVNVTDAGWNQVIAAGQTISFGFNGTHQGFNPVPIDLSLNGVRCEGQEDSVLLPPVAPENLQTSIINNISIVLNWDDMSDNESLYLLERRENLGDWSVLASLAIDAETFQDDDLQPGITYQYRIAAENDQGKSAYQISEQLSLIDRSEINTIDLANNCANCHGTDGVSSGPAIPSIAGLSKEYLIEIMQAYQQGTRYSSMMDRIALGYGETQIRQIADYFSALTFVPANQTTEIDKIREGLAVHQQQCAECHIEGGRVNGLTGVILAGQWLPYLQNSIESYQQGLSSDIPAGMANALAGLSQVEIESLAHYYAANLSDEEINGGEGNNAPEALDDNYNSVSDQLITLDVTLNDSDVDGDSLTLSAVTEPSNGAVNITSDNQLSYQPFSGYVGIDTFDYTIVDIHGASSQATVTINITAGTGEDSPPLSPSNFSASVINNAQVQLNWTDNSDNESAFKLKKRIAGGEWADLVELAADTISYQDSSIIAGNNYEYSLTATNNVGTSAAQTVSANTLSNINYGSTLYTNYNCNGCHGESGEGGISAVPLAGFGIEDIDRLVAAIRDTMPPSNPGACGNDCAVAIVDYMIDRFNDDGNVLACENATPASPRSLRLLTRQEYQNTINDLLYLSETVVHSLAEENRVGGFDNNIEENRVTSVRMEAFLSLAESLATQALLEQRSQLLTCDSSDSSCAGVFVTTFGKRAFRRPLTADEINTYTGLFALTTFDEGLQKTIMAMLSSPHFLYRSELGHLQSDGSYQLSAYEIASSISYLFWGTMPDEILMLAADNDQLNTAAQRIVQAQRLLNDERARTQTGQFAGQWLLSSSPYVLPDKDNSIYPAYTDEVKIGLSQELIAFFNHVTFDSSAIFSELFTANYVMANSALSRFYGLQDNGSNNLQYTQVEDGTRFGLLSLGAVMSRYANSNESHPFKRGAFFLERLLCHDLPEPANAGIVIAPEIDPDATTRERFRFHSESSATCYECHQYIDGPGFGFENYDGAGQYRTTENGQAIDTVGVLRGLETFLPDETLDFNDLNQLSTIVSQSPNAAQCLATQYYRYSTGRQESSNDQCSLQRYVEQFVDSGYNLQTLLLNQVSLTDFIYRRAP